MSQNSPTKHERIERHLMRQRGAGSRTVNADFGFSFAGFSAPSSEQATPTTITNAPPTKRRKTVAEDAGGEREKASALDTRGKTKARTAKRRFVLEAEDEQLRSRREDVEGGDDSFVAGIGAKRRAERSHVEGTERLDDVQNGRNVLGVDDAKPERKAKAKRTATKPEWTRNGRKGGNAAEDVAQTPVEDLESAIDAVVQPNTKTRRARKAKKDAMSNDTDPTPEQQTEEAEQVTYRIEKPKPRKRTVKNHENATIPADAGSVPEQQISRRVSELRVPDVARKAKARPKATARDHDVEQLPLAIDADEKVTYLASDDFEAAEPSPVAASKPTRKRKGKTGGEENPSPKASRKRMVAVLYEGDESVEGRSAPAKKPRKAAAKAEPVKAILDSTPPRLERRPLQETDTNRSRSPRKSPEERYEHMKNQHRASGERPKRTRKDAIGDRTAAEERPRKSRKLRVQQNELPVATEDAEAAHQRDNQAFKPEVEATAISEVSKDYPARSNAVGDQPSSKQQKASKKSKAKKPQTANQTEQSFPQGTAHAAQPQITSNNPKDEDEDIDWLFAAPESRPKATPEAAPAKSATRAPQKMKLADIDLDDLLANVAAFAQSGKLATTVTDEGGHVRKPRRR